MIGRQNELKLVPHNVYLDIMRAYFDSKPLTSAQLKLLHDYHGLLTAHFDPVLDYYKLHHKMLSKKISNEKTILFDPVLNYYRHHYDLSSEAPSVKPSFLVFNKTLDNLAIQRLLHLLKTYLKENPQGVEIRLTHQQFAQFKSHIGGIIWMNSPRLEESETTVENLFYVGFFQWEYMLAVAKYDTLPVTYVILHFEEMLDENLEESIKQYGLRTGQEFVIQQQPPNELLYQKPQKLHAY